MNNLIDIQEIIDFIKLNLPKDLYSTDDLKAEFGNWKSKAYYRFVSSKNANKPGSEWQFHDNIILEHEKHGTIILDILENNRIGGIEFYKFLK